MIKVLLLPAVYFLHYVIVLILHTSVLIMITSCCYIISEVSGGKPNYFDSDKNLITRSALESNVSKDAFD